MAASDKSKSSKTQGGVQPPKRDQFRREEKSTTVPIGDRVHGNISTTSTGPRNPTNGKKSQR